MEPWKKTLATITPLVAAVYAPPTVLLFLLFLGVVDVPVRGQAGSGLMFWLLIAVALVDFPLSFVIGGRLLSADRLPPGTEGGRKEIVAAAAARVRTSALVTAAMGASIAVYGVIYDLMGGSGDRLIYFLALTLAHAAFTVSLFGKARRAIEDLAGKL